MLDVVFAMSQVCPCAAPVAGVVTSAVADTCGKDVLQPFVTLPTISKPL